MNIFFYILNRGGIRLDSSLFSVETIVFCRDFQVTCSYSYTNLSEKSRTKTMVVIKNIAYFCVKLILEILLSENKVNGY